MCIVIFTDFFGIIDMILVHAALYFHKWHTAVSNEYDNLTIFLFSFIIINSLDIFLVISLYK